MGVDLTYFGAADDREAARAGTRPGGPLGWQVVTGERKTGWFKREPIFTELGPAYDGFATRGYHPVTVEVMGALLRRLPWAEVETNPRYSQIVELETDSVFAMTDELRDAMAAATDDDLSNVVPLWMRSEELQGIGWEDATADEHLLFLRQLRDLSHRVRNAGHRLYLYYEE